MAYGNNRSRGNNSNLRLTGLFKTKRQGLYVGTLAAKDIAGLIDKIKEAKAKNAGLTFFMWRNADGKGPAMSLNVDVERPREEARPRRRIEPDDDFDSGPGRDDSLFGDE